MSKENVRKFYDLVKTDERLAWELAKLKTEIEHGNEKFLNDDYVVNEKIIPLAKEQGLDFTAEEFADYGEKASLKLSADELAEISGGVGTVGKSIASVFAFLSLAAPVVGGLSQSAVAVPGGGKATSVSSPRKGSPSKKSDTPKKTRGERDAQREVTNEISTLKATIADLEKQLEQKDKVYKAIFENFGKEVTKLKNETERNETLTKENDTLKAEMGKLTSEISKSKLQNEALSKENESLKTQADEATKAKEENQKLKQEIEKLRKEAEEANKAKEAAETAKAKAESENESLKKQAADANNAKTEAESQNKKLQKQAEEANKKADTATNALKTQGEENKKLKQEIEELKKNNNDATAAKDTEIASLQKQIEEANKKVDTATNALKTQGEENKKLKQEIEELKKNNNDATAAKDTEIEKLKQEIEKLKQEVDSTETEKDEKVKELEDNINKLKQNVTEKLQETVNKNVEERTKEISRELETVKLSLNATEQQRDNTEKLYNETSEENEKLNQKLAEQNEKIRQLETQLNELKTQSTTASGAMETQNQTIAEKDNRISELQSELEENTKKLAKSEKANTVDFSNDLQDKAATLKNQLKILAGIINGNKVDGKFDVSYINSRNKINDKADQDRFIDGAQHVAKQLYHEGDRYYFKSGGVVGIGRSTFEQGNMEGLNISEFLEICQENKIAVPNVNTEGKIKYSTSIEKDSSSLKTQVDAVFKKLTEANFDLNNITDYNTGKEMGTTDKERLIASAQHIASQITTDTKTGEKIFKGQGMIGGLLASTVRVDQGEMNKFIDFCNSNGINLNVK